MAKYNVVGSPVADCKERITHFNALVKNGTGGSSVGVENYISANQSYDTKRDVLLKKIETCIGKSADVGNEAYEEGNLTEALTQNYTRAQKRAAEIIAGAACCGNEGLKQYHAAAIADVGQAKMGVIDANQVQFGTFGSSSMVAGEYFNNGTELDKHVGASIEFNLQSARQNDEWEHMFPTVTLDPSDIGMEVDINLLYIHQQVRHGMNRADNAPYKRRNLLDAVTDPSVFDDNTIKFFPYFKEDPQGDYREFFLPETKKAPAFPISDSHTVRTNPLLFGTAQKPLLSLSAHPGSVGSSSRDETDEFDPRFRLQDIYILVSKPGEDPANLEGQVVHYSTLNLPKSAFQLAQEGNRRTVLLNFRDAKFALSGDRKDCLGNDIEALATLKDQGYTLAFSIEASSEINLQDGIEKHSRAFLSLEALTNKQNVSLDMTTGPGKTLISGFKLTPVAYEYGAMLSNANRRSRGTLLDNQAEAERYKTTLQSPITMQRPPSGSVAPEESQVANLILTARMRNNTQAGTKVLNYEETLEDVVKTHINKYEVASIEGVGRWYVHPWYERKTFDAELQIAALQSSDVPGELRCALLNVLRDQVNRAFLESRFEPALQVYSKYTMSRPKVGILTDPVIRNWLWQAGDVRSLGEGFDFYIDHTYDERFRNTIRWYFSTTSEGFHALHAGAFLWVSELVTTTNTSRDNRVAEELTVQPRCEHVWCCPIMGRLDVVNMSKYITGAPAINVNSRTALADAVVDPDVDVTP